METKSLFIALVLRLLKPLVRLMLKQGFVYKDFERIARKAFVEVAEDEFKLETGKQQTTSRIAVITGIHRKEVQKIRQDDEAFSKEENFSTNRAFAVVNAWQRGKQYSKNNLPMMGVDSFAELVQKFSGNMTTRSVLDELLRVGAVEKLENGNLKLLNVVYVPEKSQIDKFEFISQAVTDLFNTGNHNLEHDDAHSRMQLSVHSNFLTEDLVKEFKQLSNQKNYALLKELDAWLAEHEIRDGAQDQDLKRAGVGIYYFEDSGEKDD